MNEFEEKDYGEARSIADTIKNIADNIMNIFDRVDSTMKDLYGNNWNSTGADSAYERYNQIRKNYEGFYDNVIRMNEHVHKVTASNEEADKLASATITKI